MSLLRRFNEAVVHKQTPFYAGWALYDVLGLEPAQFVVALVTIVVFLGSSVPYWNRVRAYARGEYRQAAG